MTRRTAALLVCGGALHAQEPLIRISVGLVQVDAVVTDRNGRPIRDLEANDFEILQDGKPRKISRFAYIDASQPAASPKPAGPVPPPAYKPEQIRRTIVVLVDDLSLSFESMHFVREAIAKLSASLQPGDLIAMMRTGAGSGAFQSFTTDHSQLAAFAGALRWNPRSRTGLRPVRQINDNTRPVDQPDAQWDMDGPEQEFLNRNAGLGSLESMRFLIGGLRQMPGRKSIILLSEGFAVTSANLQYSGNTGDLIEPLTRLTDLAARSGVVVYTVDPRGMQTLQLTAADNVNASRSTERLQARSDEFGGTQDTLRLLAADTGGRAFLNANDVAASLRRVLDDQAGYYLLGYDPGDTSFDRRFHKIEVRVKRPGLEVRSRSGFLGLEDKALPAANPVQAIQSPFHRSEFPIKLTGLFLNDAKSGPMMHCLIHVDLNESQARKTRFDTVVAAFDADGNVAHQFARSFDVEISPAQAQTPGVTLALAYPVKKAGPYQIRAAVRDAQQNKIASASQFLAIPDIGSKKWTLSSLLLGQDRNATATRQFRPGQELHYSVQILNAKPDAALTMQMRLFRDGKLLFTGKPAPAQPGNAAGALRLTPNMPPGDYAIQVNITDGKSRLTQWTDFQVVP